jgi:acetoin utilization protein AcuB
MLVSNWMSTHIITVDENDSMEHATKLLKENDIRMLPVISSERLVGVVTDRDLKRASASDATTLEIHELLYLLTKIKVKNIMTPDPVTVAPDWTVEEAAELFEQNKISGAPVLDDKESLVGVITQADLYRVLISLTGIKNGGIQFGFQLEDRPGSIKDVADIIREYGGRMVSILSSYDGVPDGFRNVYIRMRSIERSRLKDLQKRLSDHAALLYIIDHREDHRQIFTEHLN